ncbi:MAG: hypothetical protein M3405_09910 [Acidobacteriota bacterium]|nr:hypothetical protein [Acidobacteriota bacterium]
MTETEKIQQLHLLKAQGKEISAEDNLKLENWYKTLDREESAINQNNRNIDIDSLKEKVAKTTQQIVSVSSEITNLLTQNKQIRLENKRLRQKLESRLVEQIA